jgi:elongator complex protein 3
MFHELFQGEEFQPDMLKIYPCVVVPESELYMSWTGGEYRPYDDATLRQVIGRAKRAVPPYVRILRVIRDISATRIAAGSKASNLRQDIARDLAREGLHCRCIRCREVREGTISPDQFSLVRRDYRAGGGTEVFLSFEDASERLAAFLRLRLPDDRGASVGDVIPELRGAAIVRELHTYGRHTPIGERSRGAQHAGFGRRLLAEAERIALEYGFGKVAVIAGVGVRPYYAMLEYRIDGSYMVRWVNEESPGHDFS